MVGNQAQRENHLGMKFKKTHNKSNLSYAECPLLGIRANSGYKISMSAIAAKESLDDGYKGIPG